MESSRGCSWAACTFCLRGLTDVAGRSFEYRRKPAYHVAAELGGLTDLGIRHVTFADEDFLGGALADCEKFVDELAASDISFPVLDASLTVQSVYSRRDDKEQDVRRGRLLARLARLGLQKVFLGIESCSPSQLKRYAKGHTREEAVVALRRLHGVGIRAEVGVILFDPLCTLAEIKESLIFMRRYGIVELASGLSSHLRLQIGSHFHKLLCQYERRTGDRLHEPVLDPDTLTYSYEFQDEQVGELFQAVSQWNDRLHPLYYPAKSLSRSSGAGVFGADVYPLRSAVAQFRRNQCDAMLMAISRLEQGMDPRQALGTALAQAASALAFAMRKAIDGMGFAQAAHPVVQQASMVAHDPALIEDFSLERKEIR
jgi:hypothetical protein